MKRGRANEVNSVEGLLNNENAQYLIDSPRMESSLGIEMSGCQGHGCNEAQQKQTTLSSDNLWDIEARNMDLCIDAESRTVTCHDGPTWIDEESKLLCVHKFQEWTKETLVAHSNACRRAAIILFFILYGVYFVMALLFSTSSNIALIVLTAITVAMLVYIQIRDRLGSAIVQACTPLTEKAKGCSPLAKWILLPIFLIIASCYFILVLYESNQQLVSLAGGSMFLLIPLLTSTHVTRIRLRPVIFGIILQLSLGALVLRWKPGYLALKFVSDEFNRFLTYSLAGASMAFGSPWFFLHPFLMLVSPMVIFVGGITGILFYLGVTQAFVQKMAWLMRHTMGTTGIESVSLTANIFFSMIDMMQMFRSYIPKLTKSEFHTFVVGSHTTIAGFAYGLFVIFGASPQHLLTAAVMSAPAAVAISKLNYPETEISYFKSEDDCKVESAESTNAVEALANGAWQAGKTMATLLVQVIGFMASFEWLDATVAWFGQRVGREISLRIIFAYLFLPFAYVIGVDPEDVLEVSSIVGLKLVTSEILAFMELGQLRTARKISERSAVITTYAICGFSSLGTLAMLIPMWGTVSKRSSEHLTSMLIRIYINSNFACFLTACVAGILYSDNMEESEGDTGLSFFTRILTMLPSYQDILRWL